MKKIFVLLTLILLTNCQNTTSPQQTQPKLNEQFEIKAEQQLTFSHENLTVEFEEVLEDSRCPKGIMCVWSGNARIAITVNKTEGDLNTDLAPKKTDISDYNVELMSLNPYPKYKKEIDPKEYVASLVITKK